MNMVIIKSQIINLYVIAHSRTQLYIKYDTAFYYLYSIFQCEKTRVSAIRDHVRNCVVKRKKIKPCSYLRISADPTVAPGALSSDVSGVTCEAFVDS